VAEVDAEQRHAGRAGELGAAQDAAVAAEDDDQLAALGGRRARVDDLDADIRVERQVVELRLQQPNAHAGGHQLGAEAAGGHPGVLATGVSDHQDPAGRLAHPDTLSP
jgi:hypothetical protein